MFSTTAITVFASISLAIAHPSPQNTKLDGASVEAINNLQPQPPARPNIEKTIAEVEALIASNPTYPKLTRGEIIDLIENITNAEQALKNREEGKRALMVVMPFTPGSSKEISDLYTKPPVTHMVGDDHKEVKSSSKKPVYSTKVTVTEGQQPEAEIETLPINQLFPNIVHKEVISEEAPKITKENQKNSVQNRRPLRRRTTTTSTTTTEEPTTKRRNPAVRRRTTTRHPNHQYPQEEDFSSNEGLRVVSAPDLAKVQTWNDVKEVDVKPQDVPKTSTRRPIRRRSSTTSTTTETPSSSTTAIDFENLNVPSDLKLLLKDINVPVAEEPPRKTATEEAKEAELADYLASVGLIGKTSTTTTTGLPEFSNVADSLTPEMKELLISFGLIPNPKGTPTEESVAPIGPQKAEVNPQSYVGFKPLPESAPTRDDMEQFLSTFGLGRSARKQKETTTASDTEEGYNFDMVPGSLRGVLTDIGLKEKHPKKIQSEELEKTLDKHVFNPNEAQYATQAELEKLNKLLDTIKLLEKLNGTVSDDDLKKQIDMHSLKELIGSLNTENVPLNEHLDAPNPLNYDLGVSKNEIKRQQENSSSSVSVNATVDTQEQANVDNLKGLEESFGGAPVETTTSGPSPPRSGFYYLVDWNSFLDIDDQKGRRVNLRFQPKIGDPKRFLSVSVP